MSIMAVMWMAELAARGGTPVPTVKYYFREGLLPAGERVGATRARYDESHVQRLRLIRALVEVAGMGLGDVRDVLAAVDAEIEHGDGVLALGAAHGALSRAPEVPPSAEAQARVSALIDTRGWQLRPDHPHAQALAAAIDSLDAAGQPLDDEALTIYADAMAHVAAHEVDRTLTQERRAAVVYAVTGTVLAEPALLALRRMAHQDQALRRSPPPR